MKSRGTKRTLIKNASANLVRGGASAIVAMALPPFLTRSLDPPVFGAWALVLQLAAYVNFLDFGVQTAVGRFVAHSSERNDMVQRDCIVNTALFVLGLSGLISIIGMLVLASFLPTIFRQVPLYLLSQVQIAFLMVAGSLAAGLPASVFTGIFIGMQRNTEPAIVIGSAKVVSSVLIIAVAWNHGGLVAMAAIVCITNLLSYLTLYILAKRQWPDIVFSFRKVTVASIKELAEYCFSLSIWAIGLLLVTGLDLSVVGYYRFNEVAYYSLAATIVTFLGGFYNAIISPMMPAAAALHARGDHKTLSHMVTVTTRYGMVLLLGTGIPLILGIHPILQLWVGLAYTSHTATIAVMLIIANIIRLSITPYVAAMIGSGEQRLAILTPLIEGISNLGFSAIAGYYLGALGVAFGTLFGALIGLAGMLFYNMPRTSIQVNIKQYFSGSLLRPCISIVPALAFLLIKSFNGAQNSLIDYSLRIAALTTGLALLWRVGLTDSERDRLATRLNLRLRTTV